MIKITKKHGRIELNLTAIELGKDICLILEGGDGHIGAITVASIGMSTQTIVIGSHKEFHITEKLGEILEDRYCGSFVICCGIHLDNIQSEEISDIVRLSCEMVEELCCILNLDCEDKE